MAPCASFAASAATRSGLHGVPVLRKRLAVETLVQTLSEVLGLGGAGADH